MENTSKLERNDFILCATSGLLVIASWLVFWPSVTLVICLVPFLIFLDRCKGLRVRLKGLLVFTSITALGSFSIAVAVHNYLHLNFLLTLAIWILIVGLIIIPAVLVFILWHKSAARLGLLDRNSVYSFLLFFLIIETWNNFGLYLAPFDFGTPWFWFPLQVKQLAEFTGFANLSIFTYCSNLLGFMVITKWGWSKNSWIAAVSLASVFFLADFWGRSRVEKTIGKYATSVNIGAIQSATPAYQILLDELGMDAAIRKMLNDHIELTRQLLKNGEKPDLLVWGETALATRGDSEWQSTQELRRFVSEVDIPLLTGALSNSSGDMYNSALLLDRDGYSRELHRKTVLLPIGEYIPLIDLGSDDNAQFHPGSHAGPINLGDLRIGTTICYEGAFDSAVNRLVQQGSNILVNIGNDFWFHPSIEPWQHLVMVAKKSIEYRRPVLRVTMSGLTCANTDTGEFIACSPFGVPWAKVFKIPLPEKGLGSDLTFYGQFGSRLKYIWAAFLLVIAGVFFCNARVEPKI